MADTNSEFIFREEMFMVHAETSLKPQAYYEPKSSQLPAIFQPVWLIVLKFIW